MSTQELAARIYSHVTKLKRSSEHWDEWDDKREIDFIRSLIDNQHQSKDAEEAYNQGVRDGREEIESML